jgi:hypothetical protein
LLQGNGRHVHILSPPLLKVYITANHSVLQSS